MTAKTSKLRLVQDVKTGGVELWILFDNQYTCMFSIGPELNATALAERLRCISHEIANCQQVNHHATES